MELRPTDLPAPVAPANEQMGHLRQIGDEGVAVNVLAESERQHRRRRREGLGLDDVAQRDELALAIGTSTPTVDEPEMRSMRIDSASRPARDRRRGLRPWRT